MMRIPEARTISVSGLQTSATPSLTGVRQRWMNVRLARRHERLKPTIAAVKPRRFCRRRTYETIAPTLAIPLPTIANRPPASTRFSTRTTGMTQRSKRDARLRWTVGTPSLIGHRRPRTGRSSATLIVFRTMSELQSAIARSDMSVGFDDWPYSGGRGSGSAGRCWRAGRQLGRRPERWSSRGSGGWCPGAGR